MAHYSHPHERREESANEWIMKKIIIASFRLRKYNRISSKTSRSITGKTIAYWCMVKVEGQIGSLMTFQVLKQLLLSVHFLWLTPLTNPVLLVMCQKVGRNEGERHEERNQFFRDNVLEDRLQPEIARPLAQTTGEWNAAPQWSNSPNMIWTHSNYI